MSTWADDALATCGAYHFSLIIQIFLTMPLDILSNKKGTLLRKVPAIAALINLTSCDCLLAQFDRFKLNGWPPLPTTVYMFHSRPIFHYWVEPLNEIRTLLRKRPPIAALINLPVTANCLLNLIDWSRVAGRHERHRFHIWFPSVSRLILPRWLHELCLKYWATWFCGVGFRSSQKRRPENAV